MTLALLLTAVTGAWAEGTVYNTTVALKDLKAGDVLTNGFSLTTKTGQYIYVKGYKKDGGTAETGDYTQLNAYNSTFPGGVTISESGSTYTPYADGKDANAWIVSDWKDLGSATMLYLDGYNYTPAIDFEWDAATKTGTFKMPAFDVEIAPIYAPVAVFATDGEQVLTPTAAVGIYAESTDSIITPGKVAKIGETENVQGTLMYAVGTSATEQPELSTFSATLPTAEKIAAGDVYVWYYIKGADTPENQTATAENTFNDSEICAEPIKVTVLNNKFDIQFNAANDNTIKAKASKGTVSVKEGTDAAVDKTSNITDKGKLEGVKMGSEVKVKANEGYKFRKVEVKKKAAVLLNNTITAWTAGSYAVPAGGLTYSDAITVSGNVTLVLTDGETLTLNKGISLASGATLTIQGNGTMVVNGTNNSTASTVAGSTGTLILTSGTLTATGGKGQDVDEDWMNADVSAQAGGNAINGNVTVSSGTLTAIGGNGGSIGDFSSGSTGADGGVAISGSVTVTDGTVTATGGNGGSIGADASGAHGGSGGAAIGGNATVNGGTWTASNGTNGGGGGGAGGKAVAGTVTDNR